MLPLLVVYGNGMRADIVEVEDFVDHDARRPSMASHPVVATLPDGTHVVAYNDLNGDGSELGVALRPVSHLTGTLGTVRYANESTIGAQSDADLLWTDDGLVATWVDTSDPATGPDVRYRVFDKDLNPQEGERSLGDSPLPEGPATLTRAGGESAWAA